MNLGQYLKQTKQRLEKAGLFYGHGTDNSTDEAAWLLLTALRQSQPELEHTKLEFDLQMPVSEPMAVKIEELLQQRITQRLPMAYISTQAWFCDLEFYIDSSVLVPRSPIAELIKEGFQPWVKLESGSRVLDLCTGSGCIACAIAVYMPTLHLDASDISTAALEVAEHNRSRHSLEDRLQLFQGDGFGAIKNKKYQLIVSNPPYVSAQEYSQLPAEYLAEPQLGLTSGTDGMDLVVKILANASDYLHDTGVLICEVGASQPILEKLFPELDFLWLEFEHGGEGVFLLNREQLLASQQVFTIELNNRTGAR